MNTIVSLCKKVAEQPCRSGSAVHSRVHRVLPLDFVWRAWTGREEIATNQEAKRLYLADLRQVNPLPN